jgi:hypothetical protein
LCDLVHSMLLALTSAVSLAFFWNIHHDSISMLYSAKLSTSKRKQVSET